MASLLPDGNHPLEQEDDGGLVQKCHDAYAAQPDLPKDLAKEGIVNPLGMEPYDWFVLSALTAAGITVECCQKASYDEMCTRPGRSSMPRT